MVTGCHVMHYCSNEPEMASCVLERSLESNIEKPPFILSSSGVDAQILKKVSNFDHVSKLMQIQIYLKV